MSTKRIVHTLAGLMSESFIMLRYELTEIGTPIERCSAFEEQDHNEADRWVAYIDRQVTLETAGTNGLLTGLYAGTKQDCEELVQLLRNTAPKDLVDAWDKAIEINLHSRLLK
jgi:hypothetical protein